MVDTCTFRLKFFKKFCIIHVYIFSEEGQDHIDVYINIFKGAAVEIENDISTNTAHMHPLITG